jgi:flagellar hook assembly protein FlgD
MNGRLVKKIVSSELQAGTHQMTWNAKDENGNAVSSGNYLLRLDTGSYSETKKLSVVK